MILSAKPTCVLSRVRLFRTPCTVAHQAPLSMGFSRQEHWSGFSSSPPGDFPDSEIELPSPVSLALQVDSYPLSHQRSPNYTSEKSKQKKKKKKPNMKETRLLVTRKRCGGWGNWMKMVETTNFQL